MGKKKVESPCIDVCKIDKDTGWCLGCLRTKDEIKHWKDYSKKEKRALLKELGDRRL
jgi:predicted Fe-S protein YdhL (DUF1289 family)